MQTDRPQVGLLANHTVRVLVVSQKLVPIRAQYWSLFTLFMQSSGWYLVTVHGVHC